MSLLLDALKRAEQEKHARHGQETAHAELSPAGAPRVSGPARVAKLELEPAEPSASAAPPAHSGVRSREREAAKAVFAAKQPDTLPPAPSSGGSKTIAAIAVVALLALGAGGAYVWYEVGKAGAPVARPSQPAPAPAPMAAARPSPAAPAPVIASAAPAPALPAESGPRAAQPAAVPKAGTRPAASAAPAPGTPAPLAVRVLRDAAAAEAAPALKLSPAADPPRVPPDVSQGYDALRRGDVATARRHYEAALAADPANLDGHLGLATVAARAGDRNTASRHYRRALELDPRNPTALAGMAALQDFSRPDGLEAKLRADIAQSPQSPALHFTLGTLYASQARWTEAQAAYFEAYRLEPESADIAYNLAVSLDNLGQAKLAADFYGRALASARERDAQFDKAQVSRRIAELKP